jgi:hypothetical protein
LQNTQTIWGKAIILGSDWRQTLPVATLGTNAEQIAACLRMSALWPSISENTFFLTRNMTATNPLFAEWLLDIGNEILAPSFKLLEHRIGVVNNPSALIQATFGIILNEHFAPFLMILHFLSESSPYTPCHSLSHQQKYTNFYLEKSQISCWSQSY